MKILIANSTDEAKHLQSQHPTHVLLFGAKWCKNCASLTTKIEKAESNTVVIKVDADECLDMVDEHNVSSLPKSVFYFDGLITHEYVGSDITTFQAHLNNNYEASQSSVVDELNFREPVVPSISEYTGKLPVSAISSSCCKIVDVISSMGLLDISFTTREIMSLNSVVSDVFADSEVTNGKSPQDLFVYRVPTTSLDGTCSNTEILAKKPFNLAVDGLHIIGESESLDSLVTHPSFVRLARLKEIVVKMNEIVGADWVGIYRMVSADGSPALMKEAYIGEPSRAVFPVTAEFAKKSTNSWVGLYGQARVIANTRVREENVSYYECSKSVQSELCVPIIRFNRENRDEYEVIGIIDLESWQPAHFTTRRIMEVVKVSMDLGELGLGC